MKYLHDLQVLVLGLGDSGLAMAQWCARFGARVTVWDSRDEPPQAAALAESVPSAVRIGGELPLAVLDGVRLVLKSPGLAPSDQRIAAILKEAADIGIAIQGELDLFARALSELKAEHGYAPKVIAITGTNGKTTTTAMTALLVERAGRRVAMAGNIGPSMLAMLGEALDREPLSANAGEAAQALPPAQSGTESATEPPADAAMLVEGTLPAEAAVEIEAALPASIEADAIDGEPSDTADAAEAAQAPVPADAPLPDDDAPPVELIAPPPAAPAFEFLPEVWVLELSSFQLDRVRGFEPSAATVLNITQDHLDWHGTMPAYISAKGRIYAEPAVMVVNRDDAQVEALVAQLTAPPVTVKGSKVRALKPVVRKQVRFGLDAPKRPGDFGLVVENGMAWLVRAHDADETIVRKRGKPEIEHEIHLQRLMPADALRIRGRHNASNALAALALATSIGCPLAPMLHALREYRGEPHRVEFIATIHQVDAYDDSKGTNVGATVAAIDGLGADREPARLVLLMGGDGKGQDFTPLAEPVRRYARAVATIGRDAERLEAALERCGVQLQRHETLQAATRWAFSQAAPGDAVLLSPACASLDMFRNYKHRAEVFVDEVRALAQEAGEVA